MTAMNGQELAAGVGWNGDPDSFTAGAAAARAALEQARSHAPVDPAVAIVYSTVLYDQEAVLRGVRSVLPGARIVGASTQDIVRMIEDKDTTKASRRDISYLVGMVRRTIVIHVG